MRSDSDGCNRRGERRKAAVRVGEELARGAYRGVHHGGGGEVDEAVDRVWFWGVGGLGTLSVQGTVVLCFRCSVGNGGGRGRKRRTKTQVESWKGWARGRGTPRVVRGTKPQTVFGFGG